MITKFDRVNLDVVRADIAAALAVVGAKHGIIFKQGKATYADESFKTELTCIVDNGEEVDEKTVAFIAEIKRYPEHAKIINVEVRHSSGIVAKIIGCKPRTGGKKLIVQTTQGKLYTVDFFKELNKTWLYV